MNQQIIASVKESIQATSKLLEASSLKFIEQSSALIADTFRNGNKIIVAGNGGSLCDAAHFAEELTGNYRQYRQALPVIALTEPGHLTCVANDFGFEFVFSRGVEAYGKPGDLFIGLTTSGNSKNLINAFDVAKKMEMSTIAFIGKGGGALKGKADLELSIDGFSTSDRIQEAHMAALHIIIEIVEAHLFPQGAPRDLNKLLQS